MTLVDYLTAARDKIADPKHWVQGILALDEKGSSTHAHSKDAVKWCAIGTWKSVIPGRGYFDVEENKFHTPIHDCALNRLEEEFKVDIVEINDEYRNAHENVLHTYDLFIEEAQKWNFV